MELKSIIKHCQVGNQVAQGTLFNTYYGQMYNLSMRILANHHDVEDVLIISFSKVFNGIENFEYRGDNSLAKWIKTIVINESIRSLNVRNKMRFDGIIIAEESDMTCDLQHDIIDVEQVYSIIEAMPAGYRLVFNLFAIEGYTHKEIAVLLGITENTSKSQLRKARIKIIEQLSKNNENGA